MDRLERHLIQWQHNRKFLATIDPRYPDWTLTVTFYAALHAINAVLVSDGLTNVVNHESRNRTLRNTNRYQKLHQHYQPLYILSRTVRYMAQPQQWLPQDQIEQNVLLRNLYPIEQSAQKLLKRDLALTPVSLRSA